MGRYMTFSIGMSEAIDPSNMLMGAFSIVLEASSISQKTWYYSRKQVTIYEILYWSRCVY